MQQLEKHQEYGNYEPHFEIDLLCNSTHAEQIIDTLNKRREPELSKNTLKEISFDEFKSVLLEKINFKGNPGPNATPVGKEAVSMIENSIFQLINQKFRPDVTRFYTFQMTGAGSSGVSPS